VGNGSFVVVEQGNDLYVEFLPFAVTPEPGSLTLFGIGLAGVVGLAARRRASKFRQEIVGKS
jgi:hypothetical protein